MVKAIALIKRKPGLSREEFRKHYEEVHAPMALKYLPSFKRYVRNYVITPPGGEEPEFDCITEIWYDDMQGYQESLGFYGTDAGRILREDDESISDTSKFFFFLVEEKVSK